MPFGTDSFENPRSGGVTTPTIIEHKGLKKTFAAGSKDDLKVDIDWSIRYRLDLVTEILLYPPRYVAGIEPLTKFLLLNDMVISWNDVELNNCDDSTELYNLAIICRNSKVLNK